METSEYRRQVQWLLMLPPERREQAVSDLLDLLKPKILCTNCGNDNVEFKYVEIWWTAKNNYYCWWCGKHFAS